MGRLCQVIALPQTQLYGPDGFGRASPLPLLDCELSNTDTHPILCPPSPSLCMTQVLSKCLLGEVMTLWLYKETVLFCPPLKDIDSTRTYTSYFCPVLWSPALGFMTLSPSGPRGQIQGVCLG